MIEQDADVLRKRSGVIEQDLASAAARSTELANTVRDRDARIAELEAQLAEQAAAAAPAVAPVAPFAATGASTLEIITKDRAPSASERDDLQRISGIGPKMEKMLHGEGIYFFRQLAALDDAGVAELNALLPDFPGRIERDEWVPQARGIVTGKPYTPARRASTLEIITEDNAPSRSERDDLKLISGVGPVLEKMLHDNGIYFFRQVGALDDGGIDDLDDLLDAFPGRIRRDDWVGQAKQLHREHHG